MNGAKIRIVHIKVFTQGLNSELFTPSVHTNGAKIRIVHTVFTQVLRSDLFTPSVHTNGAKIRIVHTSCSHRGSRKFRSRFSSEHFLCIGMFIFQAVSVLKRNNQLNITLRKYAVS